MGWISLLGGHFTNPFERARRRARVTGLASWFERTTRSSFLYRWLTTEPDPEVIVIDLRETYTAGPIIVWLDRTVASVLPGVRSATVTAAARATWHRARARPIRYASVALLIAVVISNIRLALLGSPTRGVVLVHVIVAFVALLGTRSTTSSQEFSDTRIGRAIIAAFEPPEPPERRNP